MEPVGFEPCYKVGPVYAFLTRMLIILLILKGKDLRYTYNLLILIIVMKIDV